MSEILVPPFPLLGEPGTWDALTLVAATCFLEAQGEPTEGILGVAWVIRRRAVEWKAGWHGAILGPEGRAYEDGKPFEPFSCWGDDYRVRAQARLSTASGLPVAEAHWRAAASVLWALLPDPVSGASFYLNPAVTKQGRGGTFPAWAADPVDPTTLNEAKVTARIGRHVFLRG